MTVFESLALLIVLAQVLGQVVEQFGLPALFGNMLAGILLGSSLLNVVKATPQLDGVSDLAVLFVVLSAGLEVRFRNVFAAFRGHGAPALLLGFLLPAGSGLLFAFAWGLAPYTSIVVALCIAVTALPVALRILDSLGILQTEISTTVISGALVTDIIVLMGLSIVIEQHGHPEVGLVRSVAIASMKTATLALIVLACQYFCRRLAARSAATRALVPNASPVNHSQTHRWALLLVLGLGATSESLNLHFVIGVFLAALMLSPYVLGGRAFGALTRATTLLTVELFSPLFLAYQGLLFTPAALSRPLFVAGLIAVAVGAKVLGGYIAGRFRGLSIRESYGVGIIMNSRGVMEVVIAGVAHRAGLLDVTLFSALLTMGMVTTLLTPLWLGHWLATPVKAVQDYTRSS